jgi:hypothetical protein
MKFYNSFSSRLSILLDSKTDTDSMKEIIANDVGFGYTFSDATLTISGPNLVVENLKYLRNTVVHIIHFVNNCNRRLAASKMSRFQARIQPRTQPESTVNEDHSFDNPLQKILKDVLSSINNTKAYLTTLGNQIIGFEKQFTAEMEERNQALNAYRLIVFEKEKERIAALALVSCQACGWLRMGTTEKVGQRGPLSTALRPAWTVLRRSLLFFFADPRQVSFS